MKRTLLLITVFLTTFFSFAQVPTIERDALIALYNATDGANWANNTNWNTAQPVSTWYGVTVENVTGGDHVTSINFGYSNNNLNGTLPEEIGDLTEITSINIRYNSLLTGTIPHSIGNLINLKFLFLFGNNLSGVIPAEIANLSQIEKLGLSNNNFEGTIPDLTSLTNLTKFYIWNNYFQFADFENEFNDYLTLTTSNNGNFYFSPMKKLEMEIVEDIVIGNNYSFSIPSVSGTGVTYQWYKNDVIISGETGQNFTITNAQLSDIGNYTCKASSPIVTNLTIDRNTIHIYDTVLQFDKDALIALYNATGGDNWTNNTNWNTTAPVYEWYGVEIEGNRVSSIDLSSNNLIGTLPTEIGNLTHIKNLFLNFNQLSGSIPSSMGNLTMLKDLEMWDNQLSGSIPSSLGSLTSLEILTFEYNQLTGSVPASFSNLTAMESFWLNNNQLTGNVDNVFTNMSNLYYVSISDNQIEGNIDLSNNSDLYGYWFNNNLLNSIDVRNGNNNNTSYFYANNNPNLTCIFVDDAAYSTANWTNIDTSTHFVETQAQCDDFYTYVPDDNFENYLETHDANGSVVALGDSNSMGNGIENDDLVLTSRILNVTELKLWYRNITDATGIADFTNLTTLYLSGNTINTIDISNNTLLERLDLTSCNLTTLDINQNTALKELYIGRNQLTTINTSENTQLERFYIWNNQLTSIDVSSNIQLKSFSCMNNNLSTIDVSNNLSLEALYCNGNQISGTLDLSQHTNLTVLRAFDNNFSRINLQNGNNNLLDGLFYGYARVSIQNNPNLECVYVDDQLAANNNTGFYEYWEKDNTTVYLEDSANCGVYTAIPDDNFEAYLEANGMGNGINDGLVLTTNIENVLTLDVGNLNIADLTGIADFTALQDLNCSNNSITELDLSNNVNLTVVWCQSNDLQALDIRNGANALLDGTILSNGVQEPRFKANNNMLLTCIFVDDAALANANTAPYTDWEKDATSNYIEDEATCDALRYTDVPDANFENYLETHDASGNTVAIGDATSMGDGIDNNQLVYTSRIENVENLYIYIDVSDMQGLEGFKNLRNLRLSNNSITNLDVSNNIKLRSLYLDNSTIQTLITSNNSLLYRIRISSTQLTEIDLTQLPNLGDLFISDNNELTNVDIRNNNNTLMAYITIQNNPNLTCIFVDDANYSTTNWTNIDTSTHFVETQAQCDAFQTTYVPDNNFEQALIDLGYDDVLDDYVLTNNISGITSLNVSSKNISDLTGIEGFVNLNFLNCRNNQLNTLDVSSNANLTILQSRFNNISSLILSNIANYIEIGLRGNQLDNIDVTPYINLLRLNCEENNLTQINVLQNTALQSLSCGYNPLGMLNISNNSALTWLNCSSSQISTLNVANLTSLVSLYCNYNNLTTLNLSQNYNLQTLYCDHNQLSGLDLSQNNSLEVFNCSDNNIINLNIPQTTTLSQARGEHNNIVALDFSQNPSLIEIVFYYNQLTTLDIRNGNNTIITDFYNTYNPNLTCIFVDDATYSTANWTDVDSASTFVETEADCSALLSTDNVVLKNSISLSPNPTNGLLTITNNSSFKIKEFEITNLLGQQIVHQKLNSNTIDLSNLENAIYFIKLKDMNGHTASYKIIKE